MPPQSCCGQHQAGWHCWWKIGSVAEETRQAGSMVQGRLYEVQQGKVLDPPSRPQQPCVILLTWERVAGKLPSREGLGDAVQQQLNMSLCGQKGQWHLASIRNSAASWTRAVLIPLSSALVRAVFRSFTTRRTLRGWGVSRVGQQSW